jgi:phosphopantothenoylcysteine decarboxylase
MNTMMWESPFTAKHLAELTALGVIVIPPVAKKLACGDVGNGAMASVESILDACKQAAREQGFYIPSQSDVQ